MKLAEALQYRADLNRKIEQLKRRLYDNATVQEGEEPAENPIELLEELNRGIDELENIIYKINNTNCKSIVEQQSLTALIAKKDCLTIKLLAYKELVSEASQLAKRATRTEIRILSAVNVKELQKTVDELSKELRMLDNKIQAANWSTELLEI